MTDRDDSSDAPHQHLTGENGQQFLLFPENAATPTLRQLADAVREAGVAGLPDAHVRADEARYQEVQVRSALTRAMGMPFRWALNPYRGCTHACEYCYARKYQRHLSLNAGDEFSTVILVKRNIAAVLGRELAHRRWSGEPVAIGTATDPYQPIEGHYRITRACLERLVKARTPFSVVTKGPLVVRDVDVLVRASAVTSCQVFMSVPTVEAPAWGQLEPGTAPPAQRLRAVRELSDAGIDAAVLMTPLVPGFSTSRTSIERTLAAIAESGVPCAGAGLARLDPGTREHFFSFLERSFPELLDGYERLYERASPPEAYARAVANVLRTARVRTAPSTPGSEPPSADGSRRAPRSPGGKTV